MLEVLNTLRRNFDDNIQKIDKLCQFDDIVQDFAIRAVTRAKKALGHFDMRNPQYSVDNTLDQLKLIREHQSLAPHYEIMLNQCVVLLVSYFCSAVEEVFRECLKHRIKTATLGDAGTRKVEVPMSMLCEEDFDIIERAPDILLEKSNISFQDMGSIARTFREFFKYEPPWDLDVNSIIAAQACRHSIVHNGAKLTQKNAKQLSQAKPRGIQEQVNEGEGIQFTESDIKTISLSMTKYIDCLIAGLSSNTHS